MAGSVDRRQYSKVDSFEIESEENYGEKACPDKTPSDQFTTVDFLILMSFIGFWASLAIVLNLLSPAQPSVQLDSLDVEISNATSSNTRIERWNMHLTIKNTEKRWKGHFYAITCILLDEQTMATQPLAESGIESFTLAPGKERGVRVKMESSIMNESELTTILSIRLSIASSFKTPRSDWVVGKSFSTDYACIKLNIEFEHGRGTLVDHVPKLFSDKLPV